MLFDPLTYATFVAASAALILVPGPAQALVLANTLTGGRRAGALTAVGLNVGTLVHAAAAALGLSALLATSALAFAVVKYVGAAYLIYLGIQALRSRAQATTAAQPADKSAAAPAASKAPLAQAIVAGTLNPKVALFFLAFLPQFVDPARGSVVVQMLILGATMAVMDTLYELALVSVLYRMRERLVGNRRFMAWQSRISGVILIGLGLRLAAQER
ncbi:putative threonine efflux protein [Acidovorax sp. CF316]|uniref:LysE family translocator n=1 Tax=Acidovorax sp. CF316 TaxID=1144317 RepID=UPI00026BCFCA|nr:LysE family translocator [Acidovorax sp. CF316]EJE51721.1 putative threonine efflux protein [Acidovorax sp. CF316]